MARRAPAREKGCGERMSLLRVVLVDDDRKMVDLVQGILADEGFDVVGFTGTDEALDRLDELDPHVVVLDEVMPGRNGLSVAEEIVERRPGQAIVIFSSLFDLQLSRQVERQGFRYVEKADGIDALEGAIREAAAGGRRR
ncbi:MAG: response regulator [Acidimicrobiia bacterium]